MIWSWCATRREVLRLGFLGVTLGSASPGQALPDERIIAFRNLHTAFFSCDSTGPQWCGSLPDAMLREQTVQRLPIHTGGPGRPRNVPAMAAEQVAQVLVGEAA